ncbi:hypothetical protein TVAG_395680 [Trichomonas vaginalis G3]|uniref:Uncharacterized protein n=1 Tax=Trichomonas vaginalis (strain ATCC PRA-98 / G3) TaxID=412133 RepID=A2FX44_TRIV3|nr:hypothetical protein TVAGG3_0902190 [Trichomonas vaginalis G3]EAX90522.1 hypothetical protein TVAG_395680 [Trichomonas vaginalis G3]KAI5483772.1 hypothetical protein TVAGG3_0902190 [Trichomonas vaginalis G3]|eukprot:XP_001303452.1 hypothetical protein [Trichomonas vaginalis G3]
MQSSGGISTDISTEKAVQEKPKDKINDVTKEDNSSDSDGEEEKSDNCCSDEEEEYIDPNATFTISAKDYIEFYKWKVKNQQKKMKCPLQGCGNCQNVMPPFTQNDPRKPSFATMPPPPPLLSDLPPQGPRGPPPPGFGQMPPPQYGYMPYPSPMWGRPYPPPYYPPQNWYPSPSWGYFY